MFNKITKAGYSFDVLQPPFSTEQMHELKAISDSWLDNRKEKGFSLGFSMKRIFKETQLLLSEMLKEKWSLSLISFLVTQMKLVPST